MNADRLGHVAWLVMLLALGVGLADAAVGEGTNGGTYVALVAASIVVGGGVGILIGDRRGMPLLGCTLGAVLGVLGWLVVLLIQPTPAVHEESPKGHMGEPLGSASEGGS